MNALKKIQYNCRKATSLLEQRNLRSLTLSEKLQLRIHLSGCSLCRLYGQQSELIGQALVRLLDKEHTAVLDDLFKRDLQKKIDHRLHDRG